MAAETAFALSVLLAARRSPESPRLIKVPKGQIRRAGSIRTRMRTRPQVKAVRVKGQVKCDICLGVIKKDLPSVLCGCGKQFHNSCAVRVQTCPVCGKELGYSRQMPHVVDSMMPTLRPMPLSREDKLLLLEERFLLGEIAEQTYLTLRDEVKKAPETAVFCSVCGRRLLGGETCDCTLYEHTFQCPECGAPLDEHSEFCRKCGVVFSTDFSKDLFQCPQCGAIVSEEDRICSCGVVLVGEGNMICPSCGEEVPETSTKCRRCGRMFVEDITECPACGRRVDKDALACLCGVVFSDRVGDVECSVCGITVDFDDKFCPKCGAKFVEGPKLEKKVKRKVKR